MRKITAFFKRRKTSGTYLILIGLIILLFLLIDVFKINNYSGTFLFFSTGNIMNVLCQIALYAIIGFGMTMVIIIAGIDLSVGSILALSGVILSLLMVNLGVPLLLAILITLVISFLIGSFHG